MSVFWKRDYQSTQTSAKLYNECQNVGNCNILDILENFVTP